MSGGMEVTPLPPRGVIADAEKVSGEKYALHEQYLNHMFVRVLRTLGYDVNFTRGEGPYLYDTGGNEYLDLLSGWGVFALGRNHPRVVTALTETLTASLPSLVQMDVSALSGLLAKRLAGLMPPTEKLFFCNSGAEAVEAAIKFARAATGRPGIVYCEHGFHGLTNGALALNGDRPFRERFGPFLPACQAVPFNDLEALEKALATRETAAFVVEPIQGKGVNIPSNDYLPEVARLCRKYGTLFVADEIQTGLGRTGRFLAIEHSGVEPDMILIAKALSGGFVPVGAVGMKRAVFDKVYDRMDRAVVHGSTFSKADLAMAAGLATLDVIEGEKLVDRSAAMGEHLMKTLEDRLLGLDFVKGVRGRGLMIGVEFGPPSGFSRRAAWTMLEGANKGLYCQLICIPLLKKHRVLCQVAGHSSRVIKLLPALTITERDVAWTVDAFEAAIRDSHRVPGGIWDLGKTLVGQAMKARRSVAG